MAFRQGFPHFRLEMDDRGGGYGKRPGIGRVQLRFLSARCRLLFVFVQLGFE